MDRKDIKMILAGLGIAGLLTGCAGAPSKADAGDDSGMKEEKMMEGQTGGSSCSGSKKEMIEEKPSGGSSCSGSK